MSIFGNHYPQIQETRQHIEARIRHLEDKLFSRKPMSDQLNHEELQYNIVNLYNMMKQTAENQTILQKELSLIKGDNRMDSSLETRIYRLELQRKQAEEKAFILQKQLDGYNMRDEREKLLGYQLSSNKRLLDIELDNRINLYKANLEQDSRKIYENKMRNIISREELELEQLRRDREAFERSYQNLGVPDFARSTGSKYQTHSFGGNYYGSSFGTGTGGKYEPLTDYKGNNSNANNSLRKEEDQTQPSPSKLRYQQERRERKTNSDKKDDYVAGKKYIYKQAHNGDQPSIREKQSKSDSKRKISKDRNQQNNTLDIQDLRPKYKDQDSKNNHLIDKSKFKEEDSNSDSLQNQRKHSEKKKLHKSNSLEGSIQKRKKSSKKLYGHRGDPSYYDRYMNIKLSQKSPSKKRKDNLKSKEIEKNALQRIRARIVTSWAVYEDSSLRNIRHEKDHLYNTFRLEMKLRNEIKQKLDSHQIVEKKFGFIVD